MSKATAKPDTTSPQPQTTGAATDGGAGATDNKPKAMYIVGACPVLHDHEVYQPGDELALTEAEAARLGDKVAAVKP